MIDTNHLSELVRSTMQKLKVGKGGRGETRQILPDWSVGLHENWDDDRAEWPYVLTVQYKFKQKYVGLTREDVFTKTRYRWVRDAVWRLKPETIDRLAPMIVTAIEKMQSSKKLKAKLLS